MRRHILIGLVAVVSGILFTTLTAASARAVCGDGVVQAGEACDDGTHCQDGTPCIVNSQCAGIGDGLCDPRNGDCCNATCTATAPCCGDGVHQLGEHCDDGKQCEDGTDCTGDGSVCAGIGDGTCGPRNGDCCGASCQFETGPGTPPCCSFGVCNVGDSCGAVCSETGFCNYTAGTGGNASLGPPSSIGRCGCIADGCRREGGSCVGSCASGGTCARVYYEALPGEYEYYCACAEGSTICDGSIFTEGCFEGVCPPGSYCLVGPNGCGCLQNPTPSCGLCGNSARPLYVGDDGSCGDFDGSPGACGIAWYCPGSGPPSVCTYNSFLQRCFGSTTTCVP